MYGVLSDCGRYNFSLKLEIFFHKPCHIIQFNKCKIILFQVICKKFEISCPLEVASIISDLVNNTLTRPTAMAFNITDGDSCRPRYFIFNSQVTKYNLHFLKGRFLGNKRGKPSAGNFKITPKV